MKSRFRTPLSLMLLPLLPAPPVLAQAVALQPGLHPFFEFAYGNDDNLLRASDSLFDPKPRVSDSYTRVGAGLELGARVSNQSLGIRVNLQHTRFNRLDRLDYSGGDALALWHGRIGSTLEGNAGFSNLRTLAPFGQYRGSERNLHTLRRGFLDLAWQPLSFWRLRVGAASDAVRYALPAQRAAERNEDSVMLGFDFLSPAVSALGLQAGRARGRYLYASLSGAASDYMQDTAEMRLDWRWSLYGRLQMTAGWARRRHADAAARDFSGAVARLTLTHNFTAKTALVASAWRDLSASSEVDAVYSVNRGASLAPSWAATSKITLGVLARTEMQRFVGNAFTAGATRQDRVDYGALTLAYAVRQHWVANAMLYRDRRRSSSQPLSYRARGLTLNAIYRF